MTTTIRPLRDEIPVTDPVARHRPLVANVVRRLRADGLLMAHVEDDDAIAVGMAAAWRALDTHDPTRGVPLAAYLSFRVRGAIIDDQRRTGRANGWTRHHGQHAIINSLDAPLPTSPDDNPAATLADTLPDPRDTADIAETRAELARILKAGQHLTAPFQATIRGIATDQYVDDTASELGCSGAYVSWMRGQLAAKLEKAAAQGPRNTTVLVDRNLHQDEHAATQEAIRVAGGGTVTSLTKRKLLDGHLRATQGRPRADGRHGQPAP